MFTRKKDKYKGVKKGTPVRWLLDTNNPNSGWADLYQHVSRVSGIRKGDTLIWLHETLDEYGDTKYMILFHPLSGKYPLVIARWNDKFGYSQNGRKVFEKIK